MKKRKGKTVLILILLLVVWCGLAMYLRYSVENNTLNSFTVNIREGSKIGKSLDVSVKVEKSWYNDKNKLNQTVGAQYDGTITSHYESDIVDWKLIITLPQEGKLDSYWNGQYVVEDGKLIITPDEFTNDIKPGTSRTFGFVMISKELLNFTDFELIGYREVIYEDHPLYWPLVIGITAWAIFVVSYIISEFRARQYEERGRKDSEIIMQTMRTFVGIIDAKDPYTSGHSLRVAAYSKELGRRMQFKEEEIRILGYIALMHDCGKIGIDDSVLTKPGKLTQEEREQIQEHTTKGGRILENFTAIDGIKEGALYHHERYDGGGYPFGLKGEEIPLYARIICVADAYDAMNTKRCYRPRLPKDVILQELECNKGTQFDPVIAGHMIDMVREGYRCVEDILSQENE